MSSVVVDTNAYSAWRRGDKAALDVVASAKGFVVSPIVIGELTAGFTGGSREAENRRLLTQFLDQTSTVIIPVIDRTAEHYAQVLSSLRRAGRPIPTNDMWIAAVALEAGIPLWTYDAHFNAVVGIKIVRTPSDLV